MTEIAPILPTKNTGAETRHRFSVLRLAEREANYILDGTQRDRVLKRMSDEGYKIPLLPCALIQAKDRKEAAEKILLIGSRYRKMTNNSLEEFLAENDLDLSDLQSELVLPRIDLNYFRDRF